MLFNITGYTNYQTKTSRKEKAKSLNWFLDDLIFFFLTLICLQAESPYPLLQSCISAVFW